MSDFKSLSLGLIFQECQAVQQKIQRCQSWGIFQAREIVLLVLLPLLNLFDRVRCSKGQ